MVLDGEQAMSDDQVVSSALCTLRKVLACTLCGWALDAFADRESKERTRNARCWRRARPLSGFLDWSLTRAGACFHTGLG